MRLSFSQSTNSFTSRPPRTVMTIGETREEAFRGCAGPRGSGLWTVIRNVDSSDRRRDFAA